MRRRVNDFFVISFKVCIVQSEIVIKFKILRLCSVISGEYPINPTLCKLNSSINNDQFFFVFFFFFGHLKPVTTHRLFHPSFGEVQIFL